MEPYIGDGSPPENRRLRVTPNADEIPLLDRHLLTRPSANLGPLTPAPRILLLYGSLRERSYSRFAVEEAARILLYLGAEIRIFDPTDLPLPDQVEGDDHPAVHELRQHALWSEGQDWCSPERHGQITGIMKSQIDHLPLEFRWLRPTQGRTLAAMQVCAGSQSFNSVNTLRILGRLMRMFVIPNQSSVAMAYKQFDAVGRLTNIEYYERVVDVMEELMRFTILMRPHVSLLTDRYSERRFASECSQITV